MKTSVNNLTVFVLVCGFVVGCGGQCLFDEIVWPHGAKPAFPQTGTGGVQCQRGGTVPSMGSCVFVKQGSVCDTPRCGVAVVGKWSTVLPACRLSTGTGCPATCAPQGPCRMTGVCNTATGTCTNPSLPNGTPCSDSNPLTFNDVCLNGVCTGTSLACPGGCTPSSSCHTATCSTGTCINSAKPDGTSCGASMVCTNGVCQSGTSCPNGCPAASSCHTGVCTNGVCGNTVKQDGTVCGTNMVCSSGVCQSGTSCPTACPAASSCHTGVCTSGVCGNTVKPDGTSCGTNMVCSNGVCQASSSCPNGCPAASLCHTGVCTNGVCGNTVKPDGTSCGTNLLCSNGQCQAVQGSVMQVIAGRTDLNTFESLLISNPISILNGGTVTVFAPTDAAFGSVGISPSDLLKVLRYHVVSRRVPYSEMLNNLPGVLTTIDQDSIIYTRNTITNEVQLDGLGDIVGRDLQAANGIVHVIDQVLLPNGVLPVVTRQPSLTPIPTGGLGNTVLDRITLDGRLTLFRNQLRQTGMDSVLQNGVFTVFAPSNTAMNTLFAMANIDMAATMRNHIHSGAAVQSAFLPSSQMTLLSGRPAIVTNVNGVLYLNSVSRLSNVDLIATNGVVHIVEAVQAITITGGGNVIVPTPPPTGTNTVYDLLVRVGGYGSFISALIHTGMDRVLKTGGDWTVLAPTDAAFLNQGLRVQNMVNNLPELTRTVRYHIAPGRRSNIGGVGLIDTVDTPSRITYRNGLLNSMARVTTSAMFASNGIAYGIDVVLAPPGVTFFRTPPPITPTPGVVPNPPFPTWNPGNPFPAPVPTNRWYTGTPWPVPPPTFTYGPTVVGSPDIAPGYPPMMDLLQGRPELSEFRLMITSEGLSGVVQSVCTLLAVSNAGLAAASLRGLQTGQLLTVLRNHIIQNQVLSTTGLVASSPVTSYQQDRLHFTQLGVQITVNNVARIQYGNLQARNGMLHVIDAVLFPSMAPVPPSTPQQGACSGQTVCFVLSREPSTRDFYILLQSHGILATLNGLGPFTVLAPSNNALMVRSAYLHTLSPSELGILLRHHIIVGSRVPSADLLTNPVLPTLNGDNIIVDNAKLTVERDLSATNGVVHVVSDLFIPNTISGAPPLPTIPPQCGRTTLCGTISTHGRLSTMARYMQAVGLLDTMGNYGPYTVFVPTNTAFSGLPSGIRELLPRRLVVLEAVLKHHIVYTPHRQVAIPAVELPANSPLIPLQGEYLSAQVNGGVTSIDTTSTVTIPDLRASNGVAHAVSAVLLPDSAGLPKLDVVKTLQGIAKFSAFATLLSRANVMQVLGYAGPYTVFAPTNEAVTAKGGIDGLLADLTRLRRILRYHITPMYLNSSEVFNGASLQTLDNPLTIARGGIPSELSTPWLDTTVLDQYATNGIVHAVNTMLEPSVVSVPLTPTPQSSLLCNVTAHCTGNAFSATQTVDGCQCDCFVGWAGISCQQCANQYSGWPNCVLNGQTPATPPPGNQVATPVPTPPVGPVTVPPVVATPTPTTQQSAGNNTDEGDTQGSSSSNSQWWVAVLIVCGVLCCGFAVLMLLRNKKTKKSKLEIEEKTVSLVAGTFPDTPVHTQPEEVVLFEAKPLSGDIAVSPYSLHSNSPKKTRPPRGRGGRRSGPLSV
eukprot:TRINITY_DN1949_c0_g1_i1.p1 TRINITY_DN1949_c0_g1~~TRINITY_DN1949_c0_g1_i1.p1  ORF type:complete len:1625 (+),score=364.10 TRINITY_DN1949_c0_g1_i1:72-4946(+)